MSHTLRSRPAESIIESMISVTVIVLAAAASLSMLRTSLQGNTVIGEKLVAIELALEGLDAVKSIRDTNYLLFASDTDTCWNKLGLTLSSTCSSATPITGGVEYYLVQNFSNVPLYRWNLRTATAATDGRIYLYDYNNTATTTVPIYSDSHTDSVTGFDLVPGKSFTRFVTVDYDPEDSAGNDLCPNNECFEATVTVSWSVGTLNQDVSLSRIISHVY